MRQYLLFFLCLTAPPLMGAVTPFSKMATHGLQVDLTNPSFHDGVLETDQGGVIRGKDLYLQAKKLSYTNREEAGEQIHKLKAEGNLFFRLKDRIYVGDAIEFDLDKQTGVIYNVMTESGPWFIDGKKLLIKADGSNVIYDCNVSMSENEQNDWSIQSNEVLLSKSATLRAKNVKFLVMRKPILWWPSITKDLKGSNSTPIHYRFRYNGKHGPRVGLSYSFISGQNWRTNLLLDVSVTRGLGGGFETTYTNPEHPVERFSSFNYYAYDIKTTDSDLKNRYRFQGKYTNKFIRDEVDFYLMYDRMSDANFPSDFTSRGLDSGRAAPTEMQFSKQDRDWITSATAKVRINDYQTVKQELPLFQFSQRPLSIGEKGLVIDSQLSAGYLDYLYAKKTPHVSNFHSTRAHIDQKALLPFTGKFGVCTPYVGYRVIGYGSSPQAEGRVLAQANGGVECHTRFWRESARTHHIVEPYVQYDYFTSPTVKPPKHYLFDLEDGLYRQNMVRFGTKNYLRFDTSQLNFDLYARAFFNSPTIQTPIPRIYLDGTYKPTARMLYTLGSAWDTKRANLDHFNLRADVTVSQNVALGVEYRHRNSFAWRKVDPTNFMLDTFRKTSRLLHSELSDRRDTFLMHLFFRLTPDFAIEAKSRHGWGRKKMKPFDEYELNFIAFVRQAFQVTLNFQHRAEENRYGIYFSFGQRPPSGAPSYNRIGQGNYMLP